MPNQPLAAYCQGFARGSEPWPSLPLLDAPELAWWRGLLADKQAQQLEILQRALPQLQLPQREGISGSELYSALVLRGEDPDSLELPPVQWQQPEALELSIAPHLAGAIPVLHTPSQNDFERLVRALAYRGEPVALADGVHAQAVGGLIHWGLIRLLGRQSRAQLILLHTAPYSSVSADAVPGRPTPAAWLAASTTLRLEHELTHLATRRLLGEMRLNLLDELIADTMGMVAALGRFDAAFFGLCLGLGPVGIPQTTGRWTTYVASLQPADARAAVALVQQRAHEVEDWLRAMPALLAPEQTPVRLHWLCQQRLDRVITAPEPWIRSSGSA